MDEKLEKAQEEGLGLNKLASVLFGDASAMWYGSVVIEIVIGLISAGLLVLNAIDTVATIFSLIGFIFYFIAYVLRLVAEGKYGHAETLRRQAALSEALAWEVSPIQITAWRQRAGKRALRKLRKFSRAEDFYATDAETSPVRLSHMTTESAFYTRHLYDDLCRVFWVATGVAIVVTIIALSTAFLFGDRAATFSLVILAILAALISSDILGWAIRLRGMTEGILEIERDFEKMGETGDHKIEYVMRLVGEYNCIVVTGIPILGWWFNRQHPSIRAEWDAYIRGSGGLPS